MAKQLNIDLNFNANVSQAEQNLKRLQQTLNQIAATDTSGLSMESPIRSAISAAKDLRTHLDNAFDVKTGNLNLDKFNASLKSSGQSLSSLSSSLMNAGTSGQQAFLQMATAISSANIQINKSTGLMNELWTTMKNTMRWQISSSAIHALQSGLSQAMGYAKSLDRSLNDIRIVTDKSAEDMARFAVQANKAAKAFSTTTVDYSDASLIYFQQGLTDEQVKERTDVTVKMANVVGESAATVSEWMTAIWNNFDDGTRSLESYADVLTRLGAATASSADEIAGGLEKFAAVADTVGLSYDYAATALATITAETRVSEDVVGNALKTIFARIQGLSLGETLEDGVDLNKYSQALANVGINVLDANGNLRDMDVLLEEIGAKWQTLGSEQQTALAQTVAGVRQYTQFVALFDNWDTFQTNLAITQGAEGDLQNQADIYEESWAAANKRLKASFEDLYDSVIDEDLFIDLTDGAALLVDGVAGVVDALGGMKGLLLLAGTIGSRVFAKDIANNAQAAYDKVNNLLSAFKQIEGTNPLGKGTTYLANKENARVNSARTGDSTTELGQQYLASLRAAQQNTDLSIGFRDQAQSLEQITRLQNQINANSKNLTESERQKLAIQLQEVQALSEQKAQTQQQLSDLQRQLEMLQERTSYDIFENIDIFDEFEEDDQFLYLIAEARSSRAADGLEELLSPDTIYATNGNTIELYDSEQKIIQLRERAITQYSTMASLNGQIRDIIQQQGISSQDRVNRAQQLIQAAVQEGRITQSNADILSQISVETFNSAESVRAYTGSMTQAESIARQVASAIGVSDQRLNEILVLTRQVNTAQQQNNSAISAYNERLTSVRNQMEQMVNSVQKFGQSFTRSLQMISSGLMALNNWQNFGEMLGNPDISWIQKASTGIMALTMSVDALSSAFGGLKPAMTAFGQFKEYNKLEDNDFNVEVSQDRVKEIVKQKLLEKNPEWDDNWADTMADYDISLGSQNVAEATEIARLEAVNQARTNSIQSILQETLGIKEQTAAILAKNIAKETENGITVKAISKSLALSAAEKLGITVTNQSTAAIWKSVAALAAQKLLLHGWKIALVAAAVGLIAFVKHLNDLPTPLEKAQAEYAEVTQRMQHFNSVAKEAQQDLDELNSAWESLTGAADKIDGLVTGTQEWRQAIYEANQQILELLSKYPELSKFVSLVNGRWVMDEDGYQQAAEKQQQEIQEAQNNALLQSEAVAQVQAEKDFQSFVVDKSANEEYKFLTYLENLINQDMVTYDGEKEQFVATDSKDLATRTLLDEFYKENNAKAIADEYAYLWNNRLGTDNLLVPTTETLNNQILRNSNNQLYNDNIDYSNATATKYLISDEYQNKIKEAEERWSEYDNKDFATQYLNSMYPTKDDLSYEWKDDKLVVYEGAGDNKTQLDSIDRDAAQATMVAKDSRTMNDEIAKTMTAQIEKDAQLLGSSLGLDYLNEENAGLISQALEGYYSSGVFDFANFSKEDIQEAKELWNSDEFKKSDEYKNIDKETRGAIFSGLDNYEKDIRENNLEDSIEWAKNREQKEASELQSDLNEAEMTAEQFDEYTEALMKNNKALKDNKKLAKAVAKENVQVSNAQKKLNKTFDDYGDALKEGNKESTDYIKGFTEVKETLTDLFGFQPSDDFLVEHMDEIQKAAEGDQDAMADLRAAAAQEMIVNLDIDPEAKAKLDKLAQDVIDAENGMDVEIGASLDPSYIDDLNKMIADGQMTADQVNDYLDNIGYEAEYETITDTKPAPEIHYEASGSLLGKPMELLSVHGSGSYTVQIPKITSVNKKGGGGGGLTKSSPNKGGGGGGGGKSADPKKETDKERYQTLEDELEEIKNRFDKISEASDRAFGKDKLKKIDEEIATLQELKDKQEELQDVMEYDVEFDRENLVAHYNELISSGPDVFKGVTDRFGNAIEKVELKFDEKTGIIENQHEVQEYLTQLFNSNLSDEIFQQKYSNLEELLDQYEETRTGLEDVKKEIQDIEYQILDKKIEAIEYSVEIKLGISEDDLETIEYELNLLEDNALGVSSKIALLSEQTSAYYGQAQALSVGIDEIIAKMKESGVDTAKSAETLRDYKSQLIEINQNLLEMREAVQEGLVEAFEEWNDQIGEGLDKFDHYSSILDSYANIIDIVGKETLGIENEFLKDLSQQQVNNSINNLTATREAYLSLEAAAAEAREKLAEAQAIDQDSLSESQKESIQKDILFWQEQLDTIEEEANSAAEDMYSTWEEALEAITTQFEQSVERAVEQFNEAVYGMGGLEQLSEDFARQQEMADMYLKDYEQIYELSKLNRDIQNSIDDTDSVAGKQKLKKLMQDINKLQAEGNEMSEYDLEYLQKTYDLRMAEIALEEAQHAKSQVRLQKDSEGNWAYVYTSAGDAVDEAQQKYEDALFAMQDVSSNYIDEMSEQLIATSQEMAEALANLRVEDFASQEEYEKKVAEVQETYAKQMAAQEAELNKAIDNNKVLYDTDWTNYSNATGYKISSTEEFVTSFKDSMLGLLTDSETDQSNFTSVIDAATEGLITGLLESASTFYTNLESAMVAAGTSTDEFATMAGEAIAELGKESEAARKSVSMLADEFTSGFASMTEAVQSWQGSYGTAIEAAIAANEEMAASINEVLEALSISPEDMTVSYNIYASGKHAASDETTAGYDTGGYTGQWGNSGKIAVLHEKELVLNKDDTTNMLAAVALVRTLTQTIDLNAARAGQGLGGLTASIMKDEVHETLEQQVTIHAEFPNVSDHNEVELALQNMINSSTQYANRK